MNRPTEHDLDVTRDTLLWLAEYYKENEPYATNAITVFETAADLTPSADELDD